jgi:phospholipid/cholesterol/gamma-HCH transport system ATP-binding protein
VIELNHISKAFDGQSVLEDINLQIPDNSRLCLIGRSGSGKSVLVRLILGLTEMDQGQIRIDGQETRQFNGQEWQRVLDGFGVVFQHSALFDSLNIRENIGIKLYERGELPKPMIEIRILEALEQVLLEPNVLDRYPAEVSGGMRKRIAIARAIIHRPRYLIFDEPTTGLDPIGADRIDNLIGTLADHPGRTTIIITHDMDSLKRLASQVAMIHEKHLFFSGTPEAFFASDKPEIQAFLQRSLRR